MVPFHGKRNCKLFLFIVLLEQMVLIIVPFWMERSFCIEKEQLFPFPSAAFLQRGTPCSFVYKKSVPYGSQ